MALLFESRVTYIEHIFRLVRHVAFASCSSFRHLTLRSGVFSYIFLVSETFEYIVCFKFIVIQDSPVMC